MNQYSIPSNVTHLTFGSCFNQPLNSWSIPNNVTHLTFGDYFKQPLDPWSIPINVSHLTFGHYFNQPLNSWSIPDNVTHLTFGYSFNQPLNSWSISSNVTHLTFRGNNRIEIDDALLANTELEINYYHTNHHFINQLAINLFIYGHDMKIPINNIDTDEYVIKQELNDYIGTDPITKIELIPKIIFQSKIKSAKKLTN